MLWSNGTSYCDPVLMERRGVQYMIAKKLEKKLVERRAQESM